MTCYQQRGYSANDVEVPGFHLEAKYRWNSGIESEFYFRDSYISIQNTVGCLLRGGDLTRNYRYNQGC